MKRTLYILGTFVCLTLILPRAQAATLTFNESGLVAGFGPAPFFSGTPKGTSPITDQFVSLGVRFSIGIDGVDYITSPAFVGGLAGPSGGNVFAVNTVVPSSPTTLTGAFLDPATGLPATVDASSFHVFVSDGNPSPSPRMLVRTFGLNGGLLEEEGLTTLGTTLSFSLGQIARVEFFDNGSDGFTLDDFAFGPLTSIPEPATLTMVCLGLLAGALWRLSHRGFSERGCRKTGGKS